MPYPESRLMDAARPLAPIALFAFKRPEHTRRTLEALAANPEFAASPLFIFCDGARHEGEAQPVEQMRAVARSWNHPHKTVIERDRNWGLANSIIAGVTEIIERYGRVIVVEDDLIVSPVFLHYLNAALDRYADEPRVMQVSGYMFPVRLPEPDKAVLLPFTSSLGWATWSRAWRAFDPSMAGLASLRADARLRRRFDLEGAYPYYRMLKRQAEGKVDSWAIRWYLSVFLQGGLTVYPPRSLVRHEGFDTTATHAARANRAEETELGTRPPARLPDAVPDPAAAQTVFDFLRAERNILRRMIRKLGLGGLID